MMSEEEKSSQRLLLRLSLFFVFIIVVFTTYGFMEKPFTTSFTWVQADLGLEKENTNMPFDSIIATQNKQVDLTVDSSSHYILLCGDSMTEQMRFAIEAFAKKNGHKLMTCTWYSSSTQIWSESDKLSVLIKEYKPDFIFFTVGSNELFVPKIDKREKFIQDIIIEADTALVPFIWIGPPNWKDDTGINKLIEKNLGKQRFFYSGGFREKLKRIKDGAHPTREAAELWVDSLSSWLRTQSLYKNKIRWEHPSNTKYSDLTYVPDSSICAPARSVSANIRILKKEDVPNYCQSGPAIPPTNRQLSSPATVRRDTQVLNSPQIDTLR